MMIVRSPLRISLGGGGTDLPSYYRQHGGFLMSAAIDKYVYITLHDVFSGELMVKYSRHERVEKISEVQHPIVREALQLLEFKDPVALEITSMADIPDGTGLGSSGSYGTALLKALYEWRRQPITASELAEAACLIEIEKLKEPVGKQDQYIAAFGGLRAFYFNQDDSVEVAAIKFSEDTLYALEDNLMLFFTGYTRRAGSILQTQNEKTKASDAEMLENLHQIKKMGIESKKLLESGDLNGFSDVMDFHWQKKKQRSPGMTNSKIDEWYNLARANGARGGKLVGAGGGGFLLFYAEDKLRLRSAMRAAGLREIRFRFDFEGTKVLVQ
jgi:D-glycero-alpha-D-manno-heptose-7-phosphate kinase